ncbi:MAG: cache domain-containing protein, partial [Helicobacter sp.]|nr:cache domain-containing protein [Helicobacter sp.]
MPFLKKLPLGTKLSLCVILTVFGCMLVMMFVIIGGSSRIQTEESHKLIDNVAERWANRVQGAFNEVYASLRASELNLESLMQLPSAQAQPLLEGVISAMLDANRLGTFAYLYIDSPEYFGERILEKKHALPDGKFLILIHDKDTSVEGGVELVQADEVILKFGSVQKALQTGKPTLGRPTFQRIAGMSEVVGVGMNLPIAYNGRTVGVVGIFADLSVFSEIFLRPSRLFADSYRVLLSEGGVVAIHPERSLLTKLATDVNKNASMVELVKALDEAKSGIFTHTNIHNQTTFTALATFEIGENMAHWGVLTIVPKEQIYAPVMQLRTTVILAILVSIMVIVVVLFFYMRYTVVNRIHRISNLLMNFFDYLNHKSTTAPALLPPTCQDELARMAIAINENIEHTHEILEQDSQAITQSAQTAKEIEKGNLTARITAKPANPKLIELRDVL